MKKAVLLLLITVLLFAGCGSRKKSEQEVQPDEEGTEVAFIGNKEKTTNILREYYALLMTTTQKEDVYDFLETHISKTQPKDADQLIKGLLGYLADADAADYNRLSKQEIYLTDEMGEFVELMKKEQNNPSVLLSEKLLWAKKLEAHARMYPEGVTYLYAYEKFCETVYETVTGFSDEAALTEYEQFIADNPDMHLTGILQEYVELLQDSGGSVDKPVEKFYGKLYTIIKQNFQVDTKEM